MSEALNLKTAGTVESVDIVSLDTSTSPVDGDFIMIYDITNSAYKKTTRLNIVRDSPLRESIDDIGLIGGEMIYASSAQTFTSSATSSYTRGLIATTSQATSRAYLGLTPGTNVQTWYAVLDSVYDQSIASSDNDLLYYSSNIIARAPMSAYVRDTLLPVANASALATAISAVSFASATDNILTRWDGTGGALQSTGITVDDSNNMSGVASLTVSGDINTITPSQFSQFANIGASTISSTQWGYLGALDQSLITTADPTFNSLNLTTSLTTAGISTSSAINMNSTKITNLAAPTTSGDGATKAYVDSVAGSGVTPIEAVYVATTADLSGTYAKGGGDRGIITAGSNGAISIDSVSPALNARILVKNQSTTQENGVYIVVVVGDAGTPYQIERSTDFHAGVEPISQNTSVLVTNGTINAGSSWVVGAVVTTVDTTAVVWNLFNSQLATGSGLEVIGGALNVKTAGTSGNLYVNDNNEIDVNGALSVAKGGTGAVNIYTTEKIIQMNSAGTAFESSSLGTNNITTLTDSQSLTNKTLDSTTNTITADALWDKVGEKISISNTANTLSQLLTITNLSPLEAKWQDPAETVDITGLSELSTADNADELVIYDTSATTNKKITITNFASSIPIALPAGITIVASSNGDYTTISSAISAVSAGSTIVVYPGTYAENLTINKNIRIVGYPAAQNVIIVGSGTDSRIVFGTSATSCTLREMTVYSPASGSNYAIDVNDTQSGTLVVLLGIAIVGGGAGHGLRTSALGKIACIRGLYHNGGTLGNFITITGGYTLVSSCIINAGASTNVFYQTGGYLFMNATQMGDGNLYSCTNIFQITGGSCEIEGLITPTPYASTNALYINGENVSISMSSVHLHATAYSILVANALSGTGSSLAVHGELDYEKTSYPSGWQSNAKYIVIYIDQGIRDDVGYKVEGGGFSVGSVGIPTEAVFGEGDSTTESLSVYTSTDTTDIAGATYVNKTTEAVSKTASTFTVFPALTNKAGCFFGHPTRAFYGLKTEMTTAITAGSGVITWWYYNGSSWIEFNTMATKSSSPYTHYRNLSFNGAQGEHIRFDYDTLSADWATVAVNGLNYYWVYCRIGRDTASSIYPLQRPQNTNSITVSPVIERIKLHVHRTEINEDGFMEFFGKGQPYKQFIISDRYDNAAKSSTTATFSLSTNISVSKPFSLFSGNGNDGCCFDMVVNDYTDTSRGLRCFVRWMMNGTGTGVVRLYLTAVLNILNGANINAGTLTEVNAQNDASKTQSYIDTNIVSSASGVLQESTFYLIIPSEVINRRLCFSLWRDGRGSNPNDTNSSSIAIYSINIKGYTWTN